MTDEDRRARNNGLYGLPLAQEVWASDAELAYRAGVVEGIRQAREELQERREQLARIEAWCIDADYDIRSILGVESWESPLT